MTREQYYEMAQNFAEFANLEVEYKTLNLYYNRGYGKISEKKYNVDKASLIGVGILGNSEHLILQKPCWGRIAVHYRNIVFPSVR